MNTPFLDEVYEQVVFDRELVFKFFTVFSLFEYALKRADFCTKGRNGEAQPNWNRFAKVIHPKFNPTLNAELVDAVNYMTVFPVKQEVGEDDSLVFNIRKKPQNINETVWLSVLVRGVRNNLFHGGKFRFDEKRDPPLIESSLVILEYWAHLHPKVERELKYAR